MSGPGSVAIVTPSPGSGAGVSLSGVGSTAMLSAQYLDMRGRTVSGRAFTWTSLNPAVASVSRGGVVTAVAPGQATVAATADGTTGYALVTVSLPDTAPLPIFAPMVSGMTAQLNGVWGTSATNVYAVGSGGTVLHYDGLSWAPMASGTASDLYAVWGTSTTDVFAVGDDGARLHWNGLTWASIPSGSNSPARGVWGTSPIDVYAFGDPSGGGILHWDGTDWTSVGGSVMAIWGTSSSDIFAVWVQGPWNVSGGIGLRYDGARWRDWDSSHGGWWSLSAVWGASATAVFAVGSMLDRYGPNGVTRGVALRWNGTAFASDVLPGGYPRSVWGTGPANVYAVGDRGSIYRWNGASWSSAVAPANAKDLTGVWGASAADVFVVGAGGTILRSVAGGTIAVTPASGTASAPGGTVQFTATVRDRTGAVVSSGPFGWTSSDSSVAVPDSTGLVTASRAGTARITATAYGGVSASATVTVSAAVAVTPEGASLSGIGSHTILQVVCGASPASCAGSVTWASLNPAVATVDGAGVVTAVAAGQATVSATADGVTAYALVTVSVPEAAPVTRWTTMASGTTERLYGVWGASAANVYAVGSGYGGTALRYDGSSWSAMESGMLAGIALADVWGVSASDVFAAGSAGHYQGSLFYQEALAGRWNGSTWRWGWLSTGMSFGPSSVWGASPRDVFLSDLSRSILAFDGLRWASSPRSPGVSCAPNDIWGTSATNAYAVCSGGTVLRYDGSIWSSVASGTTQGLLGVWGTSSTNVYAVGSGGTILHYDGSSWSLMASGTTSALRGIWGASSTNVYAVGDGGAILHYDGSTWSPMVSGTTADLYGIWGTTPTTVFVVGANGTILRGTP